MNTCSNLCSCVDCYYCSLIHESYELYKTVATLKAATKAWNHLCELTSLNLSGDMGDFFEVVLLTAGIDQCRED